MSTTPNVIEQKEVLARLVLNENYTRLHVGSELLATMLAGLRAISKDGLGAFISAEILQNAGTVHKAAADTVLYSYVVLMVCQTIPAMPSPAGRKKAVRSLKTELGAPRFAKLVGPVKARINDLEAGSEFPVFDVQSMLAQEAPSA